MEIQVVTFRVLGPRLVALATSLFVVLGIWLASAALAASPPTCPNAPLRMNASAGLPDCRVYEQVSPVDKGGFAAYPTTAPPAQVSSSGEALEYVNNQAFPGATGNTAISAAHVSSWTSGRWQTTEWTPTVPKAETLAQYILDYTFSPDLTQAIIRIPLIPLTPEATPYVQNLFRSDGSKTYSLITLNPPAVFPESICAEEEELATCFGFADVSAFAGASRDFSHVFFESNAQFTENAPPTFVESLYENLNGKVNLVGILPDHASATTSTAGAGSSSFYTSTFSEADRSVERAVSPDGSHVLFQAPADSGGPDAEQSGLTEIYDRINGTETIEISKPAPESTPTVNTPEGATFQSASVDGTRVFFTSSAELTSASHTGEANNSEDLYEYNLATEQLTDLTIDTNPVDTTTGAMVQGVVDSSTDGSYVYFVANGQLSEGKGTDGQPNLYMVHNGGKPIFIATLNSTGGECRFIVDPCVWSPYPAERQEYVTPDGQHMAFMSSKSLPTVNFPGGYDNVDQETGRADSEVYEYTAPTNPDGSGQLLCASCDPTGARPVGMAVIGGVSPGVGGNGTEASYNNLNTAFHRVRALSDNGRRLFYAEPRSLAKPYDSVFEYEEDDEGTCESARGCQNLISSSSNTEADYFLGSSADGSNVYIATSNQLAPTDIDNVRDVYDVRVNGGISLPPIPLCKTTCYQPGSPTSIAAPESLATGPADNLPSPPAPKKCNKGFQLRHGKCVKAKKQKRAKKKTHHKRQTKSGVKSTRESRRTR